MRIPCFVFAAVAAFGTAVTVGADDAKPARITLTVRGAAIEK